MKTKTMLTSLLVAFSLLFGVEGITASADSLREIKIEQENKQAEINQLNNQINNVLVEVNELDAQLENLETEINEKEEKIETTTVEIEEQQKIVDERIEQAKERLLSIQTTELNQSIVLSILEAENVSDLIHRAYVMMTLQEAANDQLDLAYEEQEKLDKLKEELTNEKTDLVQKTEEAQAKKASMDEKVSSLQAMIKQQQNELAHLNTRREAEEARIAAEKRRQEAAEAAAKAAASQESETEVVVASKQSNSSQKATQPAEKTSTKASNNSSTKPKKQTSQPATPSSGKKMTVTATGYSTKQPGLSTHTAMGIDLRINPMVIAVDPNVIPLGTMVKVPGYGIAIAGDTGGAIKGNIIDIHFTTVGQALQWGRRTITIEILD